MEKNTSFKFVSETIYPGESLTLALPVPQVFSYAPLYMPIKLIHGKRSGPTLLLIAALYGNELNGTEIIQRLLHSPIISKLQGTLITIPVLNVHGLINRSRLLPEGIDLNRHFPGHKHGTNAERLANIFINEVFNRVDYCINLQSGPLNFYYSPIVQYYNPDPATVELAKAFNTDVIVQDNIEAGSLQNFAVEQQKPFLNYMAGEAMRFDPVAIRTGVNGIMNIMRNLNMLPESVKTIKKSPFLADSLKWITASASGMHHTKMKVGQRINEGDALSLIKDPFGNNDNNRLKSPFTGTIVGKNNTPLIYEGDALFQVAIDINNRVESSEEVNSNFQDLEYSK